jgi:hypothetical protein
MNCGSIAIALSAEYGDRSSGGISFIGSSCRMRWPAPASHRARGSISPISPMPQLRVEGMEKSGTSIPARRREDTGSRSRRDLRAASSRCDPGGDGAITCESGCNANAADASHYPSSIHESQTPFECVGKNVGFRQQTDDNKGFVREVEKIPGVDENAF